MNTHTWFLSPHIPVQSGLSIQYLYKDFMSLSSQNTGSLNQDFRNDLITQVFVSRRPPVLAVPLLPGDICHEQGDDKGDDEVIINRAGQFNNSGYERDDESLDRVHDTEEDQKGDKDCSS